MFELNWNNELLYNKSSVVVVTKKEGNIIVTYFEHILNDIVFLLFW